MSVTAAQQYRQQQKAPEQVLCSRQCRNTVTNRWFCAFYCDWKLSWQQLWGLHW
jgi:hypothetical protein